MLKGKIKTLIQYDADSSSSIVSRFNYYYDTISGLLNKLDIQYRYLGEYYTVNTIFINHLDNNTILYDNFEQGKHKEKYKIVINGKQITAIYAVDTLTNEETIATKVYITNSKVDSIMDIGYYYTLASDIKDFNFTFNNNNYNYNSYYAQ